MAAQAEQLRTQYITPIITPTTSGFPTSEYTAFDAEREAEQEYLTLARNTRELQNPPRVKFRSLFSLTGRLLSKDFRRCNRRWL